MRQQDNRTSARELTVRAGTGQLLTQQGTRLGSFSHIYACVKFCRTLSKGGKLEGASTFKVRQLLTSVVPLRQSWDVCSHAKALNLF